MLFQLKESDEPPLTAIYLSHNVTKSITQIKLLPTQKEYIIYNVSSNFTYLISVMGENALGNGTVTEESIRKFTNHVTL